MHLKKGRLRVDARTTNGPYEDNYDVYAAVIENKKVRAVVCDGVYAKNNAGRKAAEFVASRLIQEENVQDSMQEWIKKINEINNKLCQEKEAHYTTLAFVELSLEGKEVRIRAANIGDSRIYVVNQFYDVMSLSIDDRLELCSSDLIQAMGVDTCILNIHYCEKEIPCETDEEITVYLCTDGFWEVIDRDDQHKNFRDYSKLKNKHNLLFKHFTLLKSQIEDNATLLTISVEKEKKEFTFESFEVHDGNRLAYEMAKELAQTLPSEYSPFYLYGKSGSGKTHLLLAIKNYIEKNHGLRTVYAKADEWVCELLECRRKGRQCFEQQFNIKYRDEADVFLLDNVDYIAGKEASQQMLISTLKELELGQKTIVISSTMPPKELRQFDEVLTSMFFGGVIQEIK